MRQGFFSPNMSVSLQASPSVSKTELSTNKAGTLRDVAGKFPLLTLHCILSKKHRLDRPLTHVSDGGPPAPPEKVAPPPGHPLAQIHDGKPAILQTAI